MRLDVRLLALGHRQNSRTRPNMKESKTGKKGKQDQLNHYGWKTIGRSPTL
jgi:hypothetical protein